MRAGRRARALHEAVSHLAGRLERLDGLIDGVSARLLAGNLTEEEHARLEHRLAQLERLQDHLLDRMEHLDHELQGLLARWHEPSDDGSGQDGDAGDAEGGQTQDAPGEAAQTP